MPYIAVQFLYKAMGLSATRFLVATEHPKALYEITNYGIGAPGWQSFACSSVPFWVPAQDGSGNSFPSDLSGRQIKLSLAQVLVVRSMATFEIEIWSAGSRPAPGYSHKTKILAHGFSLADTSVDDSARRVTYKIWKDLWKDVWNGLPITMMP